MPSLNEYQALGAAASVSNEQWKKHALNKLSSGYMLLVSRNRSLARFFKNENELENCPFKIAKRLVNQGYVEEFGENERGILYALSDSKKEEVALAKVVDVKNKEKVRDDFQDDEEEEDDDTDLDLEDDYLDESLNTEDEKEDGDEDSDQDVLADGDKEDDD